MKIIVFCHFSLISSNTTCSELIEPRPEASQYLMSSKLSLIVKMRMRMVQRIWRLSDKTRRASSRLHVFLKSLPIKIENEIEFKMKSVIDQHNSAIPRIQ